MGVQVCSRAYGYGWEGDANCICAKSVSVALTAREIVLQLVGVSELQGAEPASPVALHHVLLMRFAC